MSILSKMVDLMGSDQPMTWATLQEKVHEALTLAKSHPWISLGVATGTLILWRFVSAPRNLPPGPRGLPIIGVTQTFDILGLPVKMMEWRKMYGEVISYYRLGDLYVVLNSERMIREAFVKQGDIFSHRDLSATEFVTRDGNTGDIFSPPYSEKWKQDKKFAASSLKTYGFGTVRSEDRINENIGLFEEYLMMSDCAPIDITDELKLLASSVLCSIILGMDVTRKDPEPAQLISLFANWYGALFAVMMARGLLGQVSPRLASLLYRSVENEHDIHKGHLVDFLCCTILDVAKDVNGREPQSLLDAYLKARGTSPASVRKIASNIMTFLADGIDTTTAIQKICLQYLTFNPDVQERLFKEISSVIGSSRPPTLNDRSEMHFMQAVIHETIRLGLPLHMSLGRVLKTSAVLDGYNIPKGTYIQANFYGVHFDPEIFPEPQAFNPSRFIAADGTFNNNLAAKLMTFGIGPRMCMGHGFFKVQTFFTMTRILQRFKLQFDPNAEKEHVADLKNSYTPNYGMENKLCFIPR